MNPRERAKEHLWHYFKIALKGAGANFNDHSNVMDMQSEVTDIVDLIIEAAVQEVKQTK